MPSSRKVRLAIDARNDLRDLLQQSLETWGRSQRDAYRSTILRRFAELANYPQLGRARDDLFPDCRGLPIRQHIVYYAVSDAEIAVLRILHERRDPTGAVVAPGSR